MADPRFEIGRTLKVHDNVHGDHVTVQDDPDGLGLIEISQEKTRIVVYPSMARLIAQALCELAEKRQDPT